MTRIFIEEFEVDIDKQLINRVTYSIDDIEKLDTKTTSFTKTIVLPGSARNNKILGNIFDFNNSNFTNDLTANVNYNFNASKSARCRIYVNGLQIMKGTFRLLEIINEGGVIEYECAVFGELGGFSAALANRFIDQLDFSQYNHEYNLTNIKGSWNNEASHFDLTVFSFEAATKKINFFYTDDILFPDVGGQFTVSGTASNDGTYTVAAKGGTNITVVESLVDEGGGIPYPFVTFATFRPNGTGYFYPLIDYGGVSLNKHDFIYTCLRPALYVREYIDKIITGAGYTWESDFFNTDFFKRLIVPNNQKELYKNDSILLDIRSTGPQTFAFPPDEQQNIVMGNHYHLGNFTTSDNITYTNIGAEVAAKITYRIRGSYYLNAPAASVYILGASGGESIQFADTTPTGGTMIPFDIEAVFLRTIPTSGFISSQFLANGLDSGVGDSLVIELDEIIITVDKYPGTNTIAAFGDQLDMNFTIPKGIQQLDFFSSILKMFYLMVTEDKFKDKHLIITPWVDFFDTDRSSFIDWSNKVDRLKQIRIKPMSEMNSRYYQLKYRDDNDFYNESYKKKYNQGYGSRVFDALYEFSKDTETVELIFAPSVLTGFDGEDKIFTSIYKKSNENSAEDKMEHVIRIMQAKKVTGVSSWNILNGVTVVDSNTEYGYAGHLDDPDAPNIDINFGVPNELFFALVSGNLANNLFNIYYSSYLAEVTDKDSRLLQAMVKLTETDIYNIDFSKFIYIDGGIYRLQKLIDYAAGENLATKAELLRVIYTTY